jgi:uncharacterized protein YggE
MNRILLAATFAFFLYAPHTLLAQNQAATQSEISPEHVISVSRSGQAFAKPDVGILAMNIRTPAPIAEEAVAENERKAKEAGQALAALGYALGTGYQITSVIFGQVGGNPMMPGPSESEGRGYQATQYVFVFFAAADLSDPTKLAAKSAAAMEALRKVGAVPANTASARAPMVSGGGMIIYAVKDSDAYENQAVQEALGRDRVAAQGIAKAMHVQITGLRNVKVGYLAGTLLSQSGLPYLESLPYHFYSTKSDEIKIGAGATVEYDFK